MSRSPGAAYRFVVVGAGPCGARAAASLVEAAGPGQVALIGDEALPPYDRPRLSKQSLKAAGPCDPVPLAWGDAPGLVARLDDPAVAVDRAARVVHTASGGTLGYEQLLLATGARARRLALDGADRAHYLRSHVDAAALRPKLQAAGRVVVIGGGFIGLEVAAAARQAGAEVCLIEAAPQLMARAVPKPVADAVRRKFEREGVSIHLSARPARIVGRGDGAAVELESGALFAADLVVVGIGAIPNDELAAAAGLAVENGILVDEDGRTSDRFIFAAGDVANRVLPPSPGRWRLEAWEPAIDHAATVAAAMLGAPRPPQRAPWVWSDQFDWNLQMVGLPAAGDLEVVRGDPDSDRFLVLRFAGDRMSAAYAVNGGADMALCRRAVSARQRLDPATIGDAGLPLRAALRSA